MRNRTTPDVIREHMSKADAITLIIEQAKNYPSVTIHIPESTDMYGIMMISPFYNPDRELPEVVMFGSYNVNITTQTACIQSSEDLKNFLFECFNTITHENMIISMDLS